MIDANVIISAFFYPNSIISRMVKHIILNHSLVLCKYNLLEVEASFLKKFPDLLPEIKYFLYNLPHSYYDLKYIDESKYPTIRDPKDIPVLANAIEAQVDILITGDKDFEDVKIDKPRILKPRQYQDEFMI